MISRLERDRLPPTAHARQVGPHDAGSAVVFERHGRTGRLDPYRSGIDAGSVIGNSGQKGRAARRLVDMRVMDPGRYLIRRQQVSTAAPDVREKAFSVPPDRDPSFRGTIGGPEADPAVVADRRRGNIDRQSRFRDAGFGENDEIGSRKRLQAAREIGDERFEQGRAQTVEPSGNLQRGSAQGKIRGCSGAGDRVEEREAAAVAARKSRHHLAFADSGNGVVSHENGF
ncbi:MAG: hypothetical protein BWY66_02473 [bacterium ADurb.Bin374]|nr:MAG: hypothetical protein BWY66_02473 [bacterium ADurb.Bin374]